MSHVPIFLVTPPFTQLNTPYPATSYLKGFLNKKNISSFQMDLGIETILRLFSKAGLIKLFAYIDSKNIEKSSNAARICALRADYIHTIDAVILFLQGKNPTLAHLICQEQFLPEASRFEQLEELDWAFGTMGLLDKGKHLCTLYLEDISDLIMECVDEHFGFSRYAERLGRSANSFDELHESLQQEYTYIDEIFLEILAERLGEISADLIAFSVPFPGNLYAAFRCAQFIKQKYPAMKTALGGGFANTELRSVSDVRVFEYFDFITLDDGEAPIETLLKHIKGEISKENLKRTFTLVENKVVYFDNILIKDYKQSEVGTPDNSDLFLNKYISVIEIVNPMHRLWSDGRWNKLTMAHGCYWGKCTFCDISLDYIKIYQPVAAKLLCDQMEELMLKTGENGFHFVDEAAPPALMRDLAIEIIKRNLVVSWWTNIRFEKSFTKDLCFLLKKSGCIAISGGLEVASDRLLALIEKGVTVEQVAQVCKNFTESGIMVHAYLMYGYPTQSKQETVDSLEMVRQMFALGVLQSGFWHQFALTAHSPIGLSPEKFGVKVLNDKQGTFANNDLVYSEKSKENHDLFGFGLKKSLFNFMHGLCFDTPLQDWFDFRIPKTTISKDFIEKSITNYDNSFTIKASAKVIWLGALPIVVQTKRKKKGREEDILAFTFFDKKETVNMSFGLAHGEFVLATLKKISVFEGKMGSFQEIKADFELRDLGEFELFWFNRPFNQLRNLGLLVF